MSLEQNKAIARRHFDELWTNGDLAVAVDMYSASTVGPCRNLPDHTGYPGIFARQATSQRVLHARSDLALRTGPVDLARQHRWRTVCQSDVGAGKGR
jgi:hypothetical protein